MHEFPSINKCWVTLGSVLVNENDMMLSTMLVSWENIKFYETPSYYLLNGEHNVFYDIGAVIKIHKIFSSAYHILRVQYIVSFSKYYL